MRPWPTLRSAATKLGQHPVLLTASLLFCLWRAYVTFMITERSCLVSFELSHLVSRLTLEANQEDGSIYFQETRYNPNFQSIDAIGVLPSSVSGRSSISIQTFDGEAQVGQFYLPSDDFASICASAARVGYEVEVKQIRNTGLALRILH